MKKTKNIFDVDKLKEEINTRKRESDIPQTKKENFLHQLKESFNSGIPNESISKIKNISNKAVNHLKGGPEEPPFKNIENYKREDERRSRTIIDDYNDREEMLYSKFNSGGSNKTLAESIEGYLKPSDVQRKNIHGGEREVGGHISEGVLFEKIDNRIDQYLSKNVGDIFSESIKLVILEEFSKKKKKNVLIENKDIIREAVINVIKEIKKRKES